MTSNYIVIITQQVTTLLAKERNNAMNRNPGAGPSNPGESTDASNNGIPIADVDPKRLFDTYESTQSPPQGFYPDGFQPADDDVLNSGPEGLWQTDVSDSDVTPRSTHEPRMPAPRSRLCDLPVNSPQRAGRSR